MKDFARRYLLMCIMNGGLIAAQDRHPQFDISARRTTSCATSLGQCPAEGCGGGDKLLNKQKNILTAPSSEYQVISFEDFRHLEAERPAEWQENQSREEVEQMGEGSAVMIAGFLLGAHPGSPETCNCKLSGEKNNDYHINLTEHDTDQMADSIVVEMTPKWREQISEWTLDNLKSIPARRGRHPFVRVSGYLLFDSEHVRRSGGERMTIWEVHPVTRFEYCAARSCDAASDKGWKDLGGNQ